MTVKIQEHSWLAKIAAKNLRSGRVAIVVGSTIYLWGATRNEFLQNKSWVQHEIAHIFQYRKHGRMRFLVLYLLQSALRGYNNNRFETEARSREQEAGLLDNIVFR